jgi:hypothetical protein
MASGFFACRKKGRRRLVLCMNRTAVGGPCGPWTTRAIDEFPRTTADVIAEHVTLELECIDRMYLNVYQPDLRLEHHVFTR